MNAINYANTRCLGSPSSNLLTFSWAETTKRTPAVVGRLTAATSNHLHLETRDIVPVGSIVDVVGQIQASGGPLEIEGQFQVSECIQAEPGIFSVCLTFNEVASGHIRAVNFLTLLGLVAGGQGAHSLTAEDGPPAGGLRSVINGVVMIRQNQHLISVATGCSQQPS